jgi:uncharacterized damage-inducible protein DinB
MNPTVDTQRFLLELRQLFEETCTQHHGLYLDKGTSLFETLESIPAEKASIPMGRGGASIAAHVAHVTFYLDVLERYLLTRDTTPADWRAIWSTVEQVDAGAWRDLQQGLRARYAQVVESWNQVENWDDGDTLSAALCMLVHTASHLGAIRQGFRCLG